MITRDKMAAFAKKAAPENKAAATNPNGRGIAESPETLKAYLESRGVNVARVEPGADCTVLILAGCPMNQEHGHKSDTAAIWRSTGIGFECKHNGCQQFAWPDVRRRIDPSYEAPKKLKPPAGDAGDGEGDKKRESQADRLVELTDGMELFHTPGGADSEGYATIYTGNRRETWPINGKAVRRLLSYLYYMEKGKAPGAQALQDAIGVIAGKAIFDGPEYQVYVRLAEHDGAIWLDLADAGRAVRIDADGWRVVANPPVRFIRKKGMLALPEPVRGGNVDELRALVNLPDDDGWALVLGWLVMAFRPRGPYPVLAVNGEAGSAKSTLCKMLRAIVDPNAAPLRRPPRDDRDVMIAASNSWIVAYDNLSGISAALSDCLCTLATGGGFATRELYSDDDERLFDAMRPVILNGIEDVATRSDLLDRAVTLTLPTIGEGTKRYEHEIWPAFDAARPRILGALLDAVSVAMRNLPTVRLPAKPRMADFAAWAVAAEPAMRLPKGAFMAAYSGNRAAGNESAIEASPLGPVVLSFVAARDWWSGTALELLTELSSEPWSDEKLRRQPGWPTGARKLSGDLRRLAPNLRAVGIDIQFAEKPTGREKRKLISLERTGGNLDLERTAEGAEGVQETAEYTLPPENPIFEPETPIADDTGCADRLLHTQSNEPAGGNGDGLGVDLGWQIERRRQLAERCQTVNPERARELRAEADRLEKSHVST